MNIYTLILVLLLEGCSLFKPKNAYREVDFPNLQSSHYEFSINELAKRFLKSQKKNIISLRKVEKRYLSKIVNELIEVNQGFFEKIQKDEIQFYIIRSNDAYFFSTPDKKIVISSAVLSDYIENESVLTSLLIFELVRIEHRLYSRKIVSPSVSIETQEVLSIFLLNNLETRLKTHEWSYRLMHRTSFDTGTYLLWLQTMIRNKRNFKIHFGRYLSLSREERKLKSLLIEIEKNQEQIKTRKYSRVFYQLVERL